MSATRTPLYAATLVHATGQRTAISYPHQQAGKPSDSTAAAFLRVVRESPVTADVVRVELLDNKGSRGVLATATYTQAVGA